jgi:DNA primase
MDSRSEFDDLKARIDLAALVGQSVELKKVGKNLMGCCPLHDDGTAIFERERPAVEVLWL